MSKPGQPPTYNPLAISKQSHRGVLLALLLVFGQWLSFAHASSHPLLNALDQPSCEYCVHAQGIGAGLLALPAVAAVCFGHEQPSLFEQAVFSPAAPALYRIRGPPIFIA